MKKKKAMEKEIPMYDPYTGELNPYYEELTGKPNPMREANYGALETYHITEEKLSNGKSRFYPMMSVSLDGNKSWNMEYLLRKWYPEYSVDYCDSYEMAELVIKSNKEFRSDLFADVVETINHEIK